MSTSVLPRVLRSLPVLLALGAVLPAAASASVTISEACPFFCQGTITGFSGNDSISIQANPNDSDGTRVVVSGDSANGAATVPASCSQSGDNSSRTIDCTSFWPFLAINTADGNDSVSVSHDNMLPTVTLGNGNDNVSFSTTTSAAMTADGGAGNDSLSGAGGADSLTGGAGVDSLGGGLGNDTLTGGAGDDTLNAGDGADTVDGGDGRDVITPGIGKDDVKGGNGFDQVTYSERTVAVNVTLDDAANDGEASEEDNVHVDVEDLVGGRGDDALTGSAAGNELEGRGGNDTLSGGEGRDAYDGGDGNDTIAARDGRQENVDCGQGTDSVTGDQIDQLVDCETANLSADLVSDADNDGFTKPGDCNDADPNIRPNATDTPDNGVDENCDGADAVNLDRDADGIQRPADCDDSSAAVKPGATEVLGNTVDEDCSGVADPFPSITSTVLNSFTAFVGFTRVDRLKAHDVPAGATVKASCSGRGCPKKGFSKKVSKRTTNLDIRTIFKGRQLRVGAKITVTVSKPDTIGRVVRFTVRKAALPSSTSLCLQPGKTKAEAC